MAVPRGTREVTIREFDETKAARAKSFSRRPANRTGISCLNTSSMLPLSIPSRTVSIKLGSRNSKSQWQCEIKKSPNLQASAFILFCVKYVDSIWFENKGINPISPGGSYAKNWSGQKAWLRLVEYRLSNWYPTIMLSNNCIIFDCRSAMGMILLIVLYISTTRFIFIYFYIRLRNGIN